MVVLGLVNSAAKKKKLCSSESSVFALCATCPLVLTNLVFQLWQEPIGAVDLSIDPSQVTDMIL